MIICESIAFFFAFRDDDDLFMVLAALHSGPQCYIVSQDHFRDMKNYLGEDTKQLFELWQRCQQILATDAVLLFYHYIF